LLFAYLMAVWVNVHKGKDDKPAEVKDFLLDFWTEERLEPEPQSLEEQRAIIEMMKLVLEGPHQPPPPAPPPKGEGS
jgi:hypothetical protein